MVRDKEAAKQERLVMWECKELFEKENKISFFAFFFKAGFFLRRKCITRA